MQAAAHNPAFAAKANIPQTVAKEYTDADKRKRLGSLLTKTKSTA